MYMCYFVTILFIKISGDSEYYLGNKVSSDKIELSETVCSIFFKI